MDYDADFSTLVAPWCLVFSRLESLESRTVSSANARYRCRLQCKQKLSTSNHLAFANSWQVLLAGETLSTRFGPDDSYKLQKMQIVTTYNPTTTHCLSGLPVCPSFQYLFESIAVSNHATSICLRALQSSTMLRLLSKEQIAVTEESAEAALHVATLDSPADFDAFDKAKARFLGDVWIDMGEDGADDVHASSATGDTLMHFVGRREPQPRLRQVGSRTMFSSARITGMLQQMQRLFERFCGSHGFPNKMGEIWKDWEI